MLVLGTEHAVLKKVLREWSEEPSDQDVTFNDFDGSTYHVWTPEKTTLHCDIACPLVAPSSALPKVPGFWETINEKFHTSKPDEEKFDVRVTFNSGENIAVAVAELPAIRRHFLAVGLKAVVEGKVDGILPLNFSGRDFAYLVRGKDTVTAVFALTFPHVDDKALALVFLKEFQDARRDPALSSAPSVSFSAERAPLEVQDASLPQDAIFVSFLLFSRHMEGNFDATADFLSQFPAYLRYHMMCSKAHLHQRMRKRVASWLLVLNRAKPDEEDDSERVRRVASGKTFHKK